MQYVYSFKDTLYTYMGWNSAQDNHVSRLDQISAKILKVVKIAFASVATFLLSSVNPTPFFLAFAIGWLCKERIKLESEKVVLLWKKHMAIISFAAIILAWGGTLFVSVIYLPYVKVSVASMWASYLGSQLSYYAEGLRPGGGGDDIAERPAAA